LLIANLFAFQVDGYYHVLNVYRCDCKDQL
jgi:hypothetical protein